MLLKPCASSAFVPLQTPVAHQTECSIGVGYLWGSAKNCFRQCSDLQPQANSDQ